jgi:hypothetical protein
MQQARPSSERTGPGSDVDPPLDQDLEGLELQGARASLDGGLLMVFGPDGDPLPPKAFIAAAEAQGDVELALEGGPAVSATRVAEVLKAQSERRLVETEGADGNPWLLAMLGIGPEPAQATAEELAVEVSERPELMLFGEELLITSPMGGAYLLRSHGEGDSSAGVKITLGDGTVVDHAALVDALRPRAVADDGTIGSSVKAGGAGMIAVTAGDLSFSLRACGKGEDPSSVLLAPTGEAHPIEQLVAALGPGGGSSPTDRPSGGVGAPDEEGATLHAAVPASEPSGPPYLTAAAAAETQTLADASLRPEAVPDAKCAGHPAGGQCSPATHEAASGQLGDHAHGTLPEQGKPVTSFPPHLTLTNDGLLDLSWLVEAAAAALGEPVVAATIRDLPKSVRPNFGTSEDGGAWRLSAGELSALTLLATPEDLEPFTLDLLVDGAGGSHQVGIPVRLGCEGEMRGPVPGSVGPVAIEIAFPPPLSPRNDLDFFAVAIVDGVPPEAALTAGVRGSDGRWTLAPEDLRSLRLHLPAGASLPCTLEATGINIENRDGVLATARSRVVIGPGALSLAEDEGPGQAVGLDFHDLLEAAEVDERRVDAVALTGVPPVAALSSGTLDRVSGCWVLRREELEDVTLSVRDPALSTLRIKATAVAVGGGNDPVAVTRTMDVTLPAAAAPVPPLERANRPGFFRSLAERRA